MTQHNNEPGATPPPHSTAGGAALSVSGPSSKVFPTDIRKEAIRDGIRLERSRVIAMLLSSAWENTPCQEIAGLIMNGLHWEEIRHD